MKRRDLLKGSLATVAGSVSFGSGLAATSAPAVPTCETSFNGRWSVEKAKAWSQKQPWIVGCNYVPTYAINQIEMWQKETFRPDIIDRELTLAAQTGFNTIRVFMHHLVWQKERDTFFGNIKTFLDLCEKHGMQVIYTFFTNGGWENSVMGPQPAPTPFTHNSQWRQTPGKESVMHQPEKWSSMEDYVMDSMTTFRDDPRIRIWDLFNEPANSGDRWMTYGFLQLLWSWARKVNPPAPLTSAVQLLQPMLQPISSFLVENSDILSFHCYSGLKTMTNFVQTLQAYRRPIVCKEWLARPGCNVFDTLPYFQENNVGAVHWGLIPGKLQTQYPWGWNESKGEPKVWHHDIYHENHTPYDPKEIELFQKLSGKTNTKG